MKTLLNPSRGFSGSAVRPVTLSFATAVLVTCHLVAAEPPAPRPVASVEGITQYQFDNGLRALLFPDNSQSKVTVNLTVLVGSRHEDTARPAWRTCSSIWSQRDAQASQCAQGLAGSRRVV